MAQATSTKTKTATVEGAEGEALGTIQYVDMGDWTLEIDNRLPQERRRRIPKSQRIVSLDPRHRELLEERIKIVNEVAKQERDEEVAELEVPPEKEERSRTDPLPSITVTADGEETEGTWNEKNEAGDTKSSETKSETTKAS